jgi:hypothetical protein
MPEEMQHAMAQSSIDPSSTFIIPQRSAASERMRNGGVSAATELSLKLDQRVLYQFTYCLCYPSMPLGSTMLVHSSGHGYGSIGEASRSSIG